MLIDSKLAKCSHLGLDLDMQSNVMLWFVSNSKLCHITPQKHVSLGIEPCFDDLGVH